MKKICVLFAFVILISFIAINSIASNNVTMYAIDGRTINVSADMVEEFEKYDWYTQPMTKMYALDGRTMIVPTSFVEENKKVGWYTQPMTKMYAPDGRTVIVPTSSIEKNKKVGWYTEPMSKMYSLDGRSIIVPTSSIEENKKVGWYTEPMSKMYSLDGRSIIVPTSSVEKNKKDGWYTQPMTMMYSRDGRTMIVPTSFVEENKKVGWYTTKQPVHFPFNGTMEFYFSSGVGGWMTTMHLSSDGNFYGEYGDSNMGDIGYGYPNGTRYISTFSGKFTNIKRINDYTYTMTLSNVKTVEKEGSRWISNKILYIGSDPYGIEVGKEFVFYTPDAPIYNLNDEFLSWWPGRWSDKKHKYLDYYGIYNVTAGYGFFSE